MTWWPAGVLIGIVAMLLVANSRPAWRRLFHWLPIPLWCYGLPMLLVAAEVLPSQHAFYPWTMQRVLPVALALLLLGVDLPAVRRLGTQALITMAAGAAGIVAGVSLSVWGLQSHLPPEAWKGAGTLAATWTGGSLNMVALRAVLSVPDAVFAPLVVVDALVAYSWMACLVAGKGLAPWLNRWLRAPATAEPASAAPDLVGNPPTWWAQTCAAVLAIGLAGLCDMIARRLPVGGVVGSTAGWTILLVTTAALSLSCLPAVRRAGSHGSAAGYLLLYLVLAALGAQASLKALAATPAWIAVGLGTVACHAAVLLVVGRTRRLPLGILATASQANVGGVVSAPLVGAVYHQTLAPIGLLLAIAGNAVGTYVGLATAALCRWLTGIGAG